ncbi:MAG: response regulator [Myxococcota bacterium]
MTTAGTDRTALIVDDEDQLLRLMTRVLEKAGARVLAARDATEARALFAAHASEIDLLILDVTLPGGDGAEALLPEFVAQRPSARFIVASGDDPPTALLADLQRIGGHFLRKPFVPKELIRLVQDFAAPAPPPSRGSVAPGPG